MHDVSLLWPVFAMALLSFLVMLRTASQRLAFLRRQRIHPQKVASRAQMDAALTDTRASDNLRNLFELPMLFYVAVVIAYATQQSGPVVVGLAWAFVAVRVAHSAIHCGYNRVTHRFAAFATSFAVLIALWIVLALGLPR